MIKVLEKTDIIGLNSLPPKEWQFDYEAFLNDHIQEDFFYAFLIIEKDQVIGCGNILLQNKVGWLANILVAKEHRNRGLGYKMTNFLVKFLKGKDCETQLLIATQLGEPVYYKAGFKKQTDYLCFDSEVDSNYTIPDTIRALVDKDLEQVHLLDTEANGEARPHLINKFYQSAFGYFDQDKELLGFYLPKSDRGLVIAKDREAGMELLKMKHSKKGSRSMLPLENREGIAFLEQLGLKNGTSLSRMMLGQENKWKPEWVYSYCSGYCG